MKKTNVFICILLTIGLTVLTSLALAIAYKITGNWEVAYIICYIVMLAFLGKWFKSDLVDNAKSFKSDFKNNWKKMLVFTLIFTFFLYISNYIIVQYRGVFSANEIMSRAQLKSSPILMSISIVLLAPIVEEIIYRLPYKNIKNHKLLNFFIYSLIFALAHIAFNEGIQELIYLIPYMFLSMSIGYSFYKTDNIYMSMIVHIFNNFINVMILLFL